MLELRLCVRRIKLKGASRTRKGVNVEMNVESKVQRISVAASLEGVSQVMAACLTRAKPLCYLTASLEVTDSQAKLFYPPIGA
jgi:hypothetical protein